MNRRDLMVIINGVTHMRGECFLCGQTLALKPVHDSAGKPQYQCPQCLGLNAPGRIEAGLTFARQGLK